jgi:hypothetical protein
MSRPVVLDLPAATGALEKRITFTRNQCGYDLSIQYAGKHKALRGFGMTLSREQMLRLLTTLDLLTDDE